MFIQGVEAISVLPPHQLSTGVPQGWVLGPLILTQLLGQTMVMSCTGTSTRHVCVRGSCFRRSRTWLRVSSSTNQRGPTSSVLMGLHWPPVAADIMLPLTVVGVHATSRLLPSTHDRRLSKPPVGAQQCRLSSHLVPRPAGHSEAVEDTALLRAPALPTALIFLFLVPSFSPGYTSLHSLSTALL